MKRKCKNALQMILILFTFYLCLWYPDLSMRAASRGLLQWYQNVLPVLFPFMILTSFMQQMHYDSSFSSKLKIFLHIFQRFSENAYYIIFFGFLCGFPMGAKLVRESYLSKKISHKEATILMAFCNNLSPVFFISVVLPHMTSCNLTFYQKIPYIFCMYGIPFLYGILIQFLLPEQNEPYKQSATNTLQASDITLPEALDLSVTNSIMPIVKLGCYIMIFQIYSTFLILFIRNYFTLPDFLNVIPIDAILCSLLEIVNGTLLFANVKAHSAISIAIFFFLLQFGGLSCIMQTTIFLNHTDLKISDYIIQKIIIGTLAAGFWLLIHIGMNC